MTLRLLGRILAPSLLLVSIAQATAQSPPPLHGCIVLDLSGNGHLLWNWGPVTEAEFDRNLAATAAWIARGSAITLDFSPKHEAPGARARLADALAKHGLKLDQRCPYKVLTGFPSADDLRQTRHQP